MKRTIKTGQQFRSVMLDRAAVDADARTVALSFASEAPVERWFGIEILDMSESSVRLDRLRSGGALLLEHSSARHIGALESVDIGADRVARAVARFGRSAQAEEALQDVRDDIKRHVSVGYVVHRYALEKAGANGAPDVYRAIDWEPLEVSLVAVPADPTVGVGRAADPAEQRDVPVDGVPEQAAPVTEPTPSAAPQARAEPTPSPSTKSTPIKRTDMNVVQQILAMGQTYAHLGGLEAARDYLASNAEPIVADFQAKLLERARTPAASTDVGLTAKETRQFSFVRLLRALANPMERELQEAAAFEFDACRAARKAAASGARANGFAIPTEVLNTPLLQRDLTVGSATAGGNLVSTDLLASSFIELLRKAMVMQRLGARVLTGLVGDVAIPRQSGAATAYWVAESGAPTESAQTVDQVTLSPKTVGAFTDFSRKLLLQSSIDVEAMVRADLAAVIGLEIDRVALYGTGSSNQPLGLKDTTNVNTVDFAAAGPTWAEVVSLETGVAADNADVGTLAYLVNATGRGTLKTTAKDAGSGLMVWESGNTVNGYRAETSNQVASGDYWFGNWADLLIGYWSGLDILVDPYTGSTTGTVRVVALQDVDVAARHPESFNRGNNTL